MESGVESVSCGVLHVLALHKKFDKGYFVSILFGYPCTHDIGGGSDQGAIPSETCTEC